MSRSLHASFRYTCIYMQSFAFPLYFYILKIQINAFIQISSRSSSLDLNLLICYLSYWPPKKRVVRKINENAYVLPALFAFKQVKYNKLQPKAEPTSLTTRHHTVPSEGAQRTLLCRQLFSTASGTVMQSDTPFAGDNLSWYTGLLSTISLLRKP